MALTVEMVWSAKKGEPLKPFIEIDRPGSGTSRVYVGKCYCTLPMSTEIAECPCNTPGARNLIPGLPIRVE